MTSVWAGTTEGLWSSERELLEVDGRRVVALTSSSNGLLAILDHHSVEHRLPDGRWEAIGSVADLRVNCVLPANGSILAGASEAHLLRLRDGRIETVEGFESAPGRSDWFTPWGGPPDVRTIAAGSSGELYANVHVGGVLRSDDAGCSWRQTIDISSDVHEVRTHPDRAGLVVAATARGLAISNDGGESWTFDQKNLHAAYSRAVALCEDTILLTACVGPWGGRAAVYRCDLAGRGSFEKCEGGLPDWFGDNIDSGCLATSGALAAFGTSDGDVYASEDAGVMWTRIASGLAPVHAVAIF